MTLGSWADRLFRAAMRLQERPKLCYAIALAAFGFALALRFAVNEALPSGFPYLTFFPAVLLTAFFCGTGPGILSAVLSVLAAWYWFIVPVESFALDLQSAVAVLFFVVILAADLLIIDTMRAAVSRLTREKARTSELLDRQRTLFEELQHRTANNMAFIGALLSMQKRQVADQPAAVRALEEAATRLNTMAQVHRRLYDPTNIDLPVGKYLHDLLQDVMTSSGAPGVQIEVTSTVPRMEIDRLITLSLSATEIAINSAKHGFAGRSGGKLQVSLHTSADGADHVFVVRDDGPGFPDDFDPAGSDRLGFRVLRGFARTLNGTLAFRSDNGAVTELVYPAAPSRSDVDDASTPEAATGSPR